MAGAAGRLRADHHHNHDRGGDHDHRRHHHHHDRGADDDHHHPHHQHDHGADDDPPHRHHQHDPAADAHPPAPPPQQLGGYTVAPYQQAVDVFNAMNCSNSSPQNAVGCLAGQLLAAKLNVANGSNPCIPPSISQADAFLVSIGYAGPTGPTS